MRVPEIKSSQVNLDLVSTCVVFYRIKNLVIVFGRPRIFHQRHVEYWHPIRNIRFAISNRRY